SASALAPRVVTTCKTSDMARDLLSRLRISPSTSEKRDVPPLGLCAVHLTRVDLPRGDHFDAFRSHLAKETTRIPLVTRGARLMDAKQNRIRVTIEIYRLDALDMPAFLPLAP